MSSLRRAVQPRIFAGLTGGTANRLVSPGMQDFAGPLCKSKSVEIASFSGRVFNHGAKGETFSAVTPKTWKSIALAKMAFAPSPSASLFSLKQEDVPSVTPVFGRCFTCTAENGESPGVFYSTATFFVVIFIPLSGGTKRLDRSCGFSPLIAPKKNRYLLMYIIAV
jgi:hypothetical protein